MVDQSEVFYWATNVCDCNGCYHGYYEEDMIVYYFHVHNSLMKKDLERELVVDGKNCNYYFDDEIVADNILVVGMGLNIDILIDTMIPSMNRIPELND